MEKKYANLHFHSTHSDGVDTPEKLVEIAVAEGYKALALTDHDTATGTDELIEACKKHNLEYILGTEFTGVAFGIQFHIVGLDFDPNHPRMKEHLEYMSKKCVYRTKGLFDQGVARGTITGITWEEVAEANKGITYLCVDHVFRALRKKNIIQDKDYDNFHWENFSYYNRPFENIYHDRSAEEVISIINDAGGVAILAHPGKELLPHLPELIDMGIKGVESWHPNHSDEVATEIERLAEKYNLYISGGTDHSGLMGGHYQYCDDPTQDKHYVPSLKYGVTEENFRKIKNRVLG